MTLECFFVRVGDQLGKVVGASGNVAEVEFFKAPVPGARETKSIEIGELRRLNLERQTRVWWNDNGQWRIGRILEPPDQNTQKYLIALPDRQNAELSCSEFSVVSDTIKDPVSLIAARTADARFFVGLRLAKLSRPIKRSDLAVDVRFEGAEILSQPQMGNPSVLTPEEVDAIIDRIDDFEGFLDALPEVDDDEPEVDEILDAVIEEAKRRGYDTTPVVDDAAPYDLVLTRPNDAPIAVHLVVTEDNGGVVVDGDTVEFAQRAADAGEAFGLASVELEWSEDDDLSFAVKGVTFEIPWLPTHDQLEPVAFRYAP
jgi:hypothetical protein